jgi:transcriptional regulator with XRE-family HTH domain
VAKLNTDLPLLVIVGERVRKRREELGLSQEALGGGARLHRTYISDIERGRRNISIDVLERIADALGVPVAVFFI